MVLTTESHILNDFKSSLPKRSLKNPLLEKSSAKRAKTDPSNLPTRRLTASFSTKNALLEKLTKSVGLNRQSSFLGSNDVCSNVETGRKKSWSDAKPFAVKNMLLESHVSKICDRKSYISNPFLEDRTKANFSSLTKSNVLARGHQKPDLRTSSTLLAPTFNLAKSPSAEFALKGPTLGSQDSALPDTCELSLLTKEDIHTISKSVGEPELSFPSPNSMKDTTSVVRSRLDMIKADLIGVACTSLINNPIWFSEKNPTRSTIFELCEEIAMSDPEFVLKIALYTRVELNIRTACNFMLAVASLLPPCRPFLKKYYCRAIGLPSDWIQIAEFYKSLCDPSGEKGSLNLPVALRKVMVTKFPNFDEYQLAKYNKDKSKNAKKKEKVKKKKEATPSGKNQNMRDEHPSQDDGNEGKKQEESESQKLYVPSYTLKYLIRKLHIVQPAHAVMCILGKKYPPSVSEFYKCGLEGSWDSALSGKRMKLEVPETWETQVSAKGNVAKTWENLLDHRKLPFMAMLRNIRNMIKAGISEKHHQQILKTLTNERAVSRSKQFPFRFFSAYEVLDELSTELSKQESYKQYGFRYFLNRQEKQQMQRKFGDNTPKTDECKRLDFLRRRIASKYGKPFLYNEEIIERYRKALNEAVKIATLNNVSPIPGHTVVLCEASEEMLSKKCTTSKGLGSSRSLGEVGILLGLMCAYSCEACTFIIYSGSSYICVELEKGGILENLSRICSLARLTFQNKKKSLPKKLLSNLVLNRIKLDSFLVVSSSFNDVEEILMEHSLEDYRSDVNSSMLCYKVALNGKRSSVTNKPGVISFNGYSDQILKFIALGTAEAQMKHVETIDMRLNLAELRDTSLYESLPPMMSKPVSPWRTVRVFISSTIKDMMNERDVLVTKVLPLLREKAKSLKMHVLETDLRWGITGEDTRYGRNLSICLQEVQKCDIFIGLLGERYGWVPHTYGFSDEKTKWLENYPKGRSITELEIAQAGFQGKNENKMCLFYIRDSSQIKSAIPKSAKEVLFEKNLKKISKLKQLKNRILESSHYIGESYTPKWDTIQNGVMKLTGLEEFESIITDDLFAKLKAISDKNAECRMHNAGRFDMHQEFARQQDFVARSSLMSAIMRKITEKQLTDAFLLAIVGETGSGKTAILANVYRRISSDRNNIVCVHFARTDLQDAQYTSNALRHICSIIAQACNLDFDLENNNAHLIDLLKKLMETLHKKRPGSPSVYVLVDEIDSFDNVEWIAKLVNEKISVVVTCVDGGNAHKALKHMEATTFVTVPELTITDKREIVRSALGKYSKKLDESHFNNQLQVLMSKRKSTNPMYLSNICDAIRVNETFESLGETLKAIPHDMEGSLKWQLNCVEAKFSNYPGLVAAVFGILYCSGQWKIGDDNLYEVLSSWFHTDKENAVPKAVVFNIIYCVKSFLSVSESQSGKVMALQQSVYRQVLQEKYFGDPAFIRRCHLFLADYCITKIRSCLSGVVDTFMLIDCLKRLPTHLSKSGQDHALTDHLSDIGFVMLKCKLGLGESLLEDFQLLKESFLGKSLKRSNLQENLKPWKEMENFVKSSINTISNYPNFIYQEAFNQKQGSYPRTIALMRNFEDTQSEMVHMEQGLYDRDNAAVQTFKNSTHDDPLTCFSVCGANQIFSAGTLSGKVKIIHKSTGKEISYMGHCNPVTALCFINKTILVSAASDGNMIVWDVAAGHKISDIKLHENRVTAVVVRPTSQGKSGQIFVSASNDRSIAIWSVNKWKLVKRISVGSPVNCMDFHPHEPKVAVGLWDASICIWDVQTYTRLAVIRGHEKAVSSLQFSSCGTFIASCSKYENIVRLWASSTGIPLGNFSETYLVSPEAVVFSSDCKYLIGSGAGTNEDSAQIAIWNSRLGKAELRYQVDDIEEFGSALCCRYNSSKSAIAVGFHEGYLNIFDCRLPDPIYSLKLHDSAISCVTWSPEKAQNIFAGLFSSEHDIEVVITGSHDNTLKAVAFETKSVVAICEGHTAPVIACDCSTKWLASGAEDFSILLWRMSDINSQCDDEQLTSNCNIAQQNQSDKNASMRSIRTVSHAKAARGHDGPVSCVTFNSSGNLLMSGGRDGKIFFWDVQDYVQQQSNVSNGCAHVDNLKPILSIHQAHKDWITCCAWNDHSDTVVTGSNDSTLKIWKSPSSTMAIQREEHGAPLHILTGHTSGVTSVAYKMGCVVSTGGEDRTIKIWSHKGMEITSLEAESRTNDCDIRFQKASIIEDDSSEYSESTDSSAQWADQVDAQEWREDHDKRKPGAKKKEAPTAQMQKFDVLCVSNDTSIVLWKPLAGQKVNVLSEQAKSISALQIYDKEQILSQSSNGIIKAWDVRSTTSTFRQNGEATGIASIDGGLVTTCSAGYVYLLDMIDHNTLNLQYKAKIHGKSITDLCRIQRNVFATSSYDKSVILWSVETVQSGKEHRTRKISVMDSVACRDPLRCIALSASHGEAFKLTVGDVYPSCYEVILGGEKKTCLGFTDSEDENSIRDSVPQHEKIVGGFRGQRSTPHMVTHKGTVVGGKNVQIDDGDFISCFLHASDHSRLDEGLLLGSTGGNLYHSAGNVKTKIHDSKVTAILNTGRYFVTTSHDSTIKVWEKQSWKQVGQFCNSSPVTVASVIEERILAYGDSSGAINTIILHF